MNQFVCKFIRNSGTLLYFFFFGGPGHSQNLNRTFTAAVNWADDEERHREEMHGCEIDHRTSSRI